MGLKVKKSTLAKGLIIFIVLTVGVMVGILLWTTENETWSQMMAFEWIFVPVLLGLGIVRWFFDGMAFVTLSRHNFHSSVRLLRSTVIRLEGNFVAAIVPVLVVRFPCTAISSTGKKYR